MQFLVITAHNSEYAIHLSPISGYFGLLSELTFHIKRSNSAHKRLRYNFMRNLFTQFNIKHSPMTLIKVDSVGRLHKQQNRKVGSATQPLHPYSVWWEIGGEAEEEKKQARLCWPMCCHPQNHFASSLYFPHRSSQCTLSPEKTETSLILFHNRSLGQFLIFLMIPHHSWDTIFLSLSCSRCCWK